MDGYRDLRAEQARQVIDVEQVFTSYEAASAEWALRFSGAMSWKEVGGRRYLYRKRGDAWKSLGPTGPDTERAYRAFHDGRERARDRLAGLVRRLDEMAPVNRALQLGRVPLIAARVLRAIVKAKLMGGAIEVVGTNALFAYERLAGVQVAGGNLATADMDLLFDARASLRLLTPSVATAGVAGLLRRVDRSFEPTARGSFRAVNRDGFMIDLIQPLPSRPMAAPARRRLGSDEDDLEAVEIEGLAWLVNSPKVEVTVLDERGYPLTMACPDPRAFALHKAWLAGRSDRDPAKRGRDAAQARLVADLVATRLPHTPFDDPALDAIPRALRRLAAEIVPPRERGTSAASLVPDWG